MRKFALIILMVIALTPAAGSASDLPKAYIGLYSDAWHSDCSAYFDDMDAFNLYVWVIPGTDGLKCVKFDLDYTYMYGAIGVMQTRINPDFRTTVSGDPWTGVTVCVAPCQTGWTYIYKFVMFSSSRIVGMITINGETVQISTCEDGYPAAPLTILNYLALNQPCEIATDNFSWGAIKSLYGE